MIIEVADTSLRYDVDVKVLLYAKHGIREVCIVDLARRELVRYRDSGRDGYATRDVLPPNATVAPVALPRALIALERILT